MHSAVRRSVYRHYIAVILRRTPSQPHSVVVPTANSTQDTMLDAMARESMRAIILSQKRKLKS